MIPRERCDLGAPSHFPPEDGIGTRGRGPVQIITEDGDYQDSHILQVLTGSAEFSVVGVIGGSGCGKSTLLNHILGVGRQEVLGFAVGQHAPRSYLETTGIWAQVNSEGLIGLDCQASGSAAALAAGAAAPDLPPGIVPQRGLKSPQSKWRQERRLELQRLIFMLKVCSILVVVSGEGGGGDVWEQLQTAEMLSRGIADPSLQGLTPEERAEHSNQEYLPAVVFVHSEEGEGNSTSRHLLKGAVGDFFKGSRLLHHQPPRVCLLPRSPSPGPTLQDRLLLAVATVLETPRPKFGRPVTEEAWQRGCRAVWQALEASKELDQYEKFWSGGASV